MRLFSQYPQISNVLRSSQFLLQESNVLRLSNPHIKPALAVLRKTGSVADRPTLQDGVAYLEADNVRPTMFDVSQMVEDYNAERITRRTASWSPLIAGSSTAPARADRRGTSPLLNRDFGSLRAMFL